MYFAYISSYYIFKATIEFGMIQSVWRKSVGPNEFTEQEKSISHISAKSTMDDMCSFTINFHYLLTANRLNPLFSNEISQ